MKIILTETEPRQEGNNYYHMVDVVLPSGRMIRVYTNTKDGGQLPDGMSEVVLGEMEGDSGSPVWCEEFHPLTLGEVVLLRGVMED